jgi:hypothetical protein
MRGIYGTQDRLTRDGARVVEDLPALPSVFTPIIALREGGDALRHACAIAPEKGAGTLVWVRSWARAEAAIVLEPEEALPAARLALHAASVALADALGAYGPPDIPLVFEWPGTLRLNGAVVGQTRLALPAETSPDGTPPWLVVGMEADHVLAGPAVMGMMDSALYMMRHARTTGLVAARGRRLGLTLKEMGISGLAGPPVGRLGRSCVPW